MKKKIMLFLMLVAPLSALAFELAPAEPWTRERIEILLSNVANFLIGAAITGAVIGLVWAGILYFTSGFNADAVKKSQRFI